MIAVDTNVLVRILVDDDPKQSAAARQWFSANEREGILVDHIVLVELVWVLRARYRQPREAIAKALELLLATGGIIVPEEQLVRGALAGYRNGRGDFADHLIKHRANARGASPVGTFDEELHGLKGFTRVR